MQEVTTNEYKIVLLGQSGVGKSCLVLRFCRGQFFENREPTIGASYLTKSISINSRDLKLQIWDTAGQERYQSLAPMYYRNSEIAVVVYDICSEDSFNKAKEWVKELSIKGLPDLIIGFVGNKTDLEKKRAVLTRDAEMYCENHNLHFFETSAKTGEQVKDLFFYLATELMKLPKNQKHMTTKTSKNTIKDISAIDNDEKRKGCC
ncbi:ras-related protein rab-5c [Anaeramoeba flamelloides]|uniref:Ras-related protein rab-5c n=1 Tax=Anaeramoeba flamelloides TaxID=1746091 RepID=A0AAV7YKQ6_9EUKA|nr:ras-related protein rab-5c [Anaeramoeba flamelloides]KAJ6226437.1 ras-related protein rab-5c [Anaeramoeba flamelloides]